MAKKNKYRDINLSFDRNPVTGDILIATDVEAIKKSLRNLILTNFFEIPFAPDKGSNIQGSLFENFSPLTAEFLKQKLRELIDRYEPRVECTRVVIIQRDDHHSLEITLYFRIRNLQLEEQFTVFVERTR